ncbi:hypothetical protein [uncultured Croceitalea sp.]|uniref:hypothetical protein n=1 Tax=uncultured Croceitalea sp. TaxID=1798908 RepID=UPI00374FBE71
MKNTIFILLLFCTWQLLSQQQEEIKYELPKIIPPAPDVQQLEKYGDIPIGYYTGTANIDISLYQIQTQTGLTVPISLSYHPSGIKVDEKASRVGLGWSLKAEGVISRSVAGIKDFITSEPRPVIDGSFDPNNHSNFDDYKYAKDVIAGDADSEPDTFQYNFLGKSGKFIFDQNRQIHLIPKDAIKLTTNNPISQFTIIDEMGNTFFFQATGISRIYSACGAGGLSNFYDNNIATSWKLSKITTYTGEEIDFHYRNFNYEYILSEDVTDYHRYGSLFGCPVKAPEDCIKNMIHTESVLDKITFTNGEVQFTYSDDPSYPINGSNIRQDFSGNHALRRITVSNGSKTIKSFEMIYNYFGPSGTSSEDDNRLKLVELIETNSTKKHTFQYNETVNLPPRFSYAQDLWGHYNGEDNNTTILPQIYVAGQLIPGADRNVSSLHGQANILTKITYPTKGSSEFFYESNDYYETQTTTEYATGGFTRYADFDNTNQNQYPFTIQSSYQNIEIEINNQCGNPPDQFFLENGAIAKIFNSNQQEVGRFVSSGTQSLNLTAGNYTLVFEVDGPSCLFTAKLKWHTEQPIAPHNKLTGGLRIQKVKNFDGIDYEEKLYEYTLENSTQSSGYLQGIPQFYYSIIEPDPQNLSTCSYIARGHSSIYPLSTALGNSVGYSKIMEINKSEAENGKNVYTFTNDPDIYAGTGLRFPNVPPISYSWKRGLLLNKTSYDANNAKVQEEINNYDFDTSFISASSESYGGDKLAAGIIFKQTRNEEPLTNATFLWDVYYITSAWVKPVSRQTISYLPTQVSQTQNYFYENLAHLQRTKTETVGSNNKLQIGKWYYPDDVDNLPSEGLTSAQITEINKLRYDQAHRIGVPIQIHRISDGEEMISRTLFETGANGLTLPNIIKSKKGTMSMENRIVYHQYDNLGNVLKVSQENGPFISYIWGYNNKYPIAKLENLDYSSIPTSTITNLQNISINDTETVLKTALNNLRSQFPNALISTYTYDPLIGVTSMTDPSGYTMSYEYDEFNRLKWVKDAGNNILSENIYHYKNQ